MRHLRPYLALLTIAALAVACSPGSSSGGESQGTEPSTGSQPSQAAASSGGGGGGGGISGANGSLSYEISGDVTQSGDLNFVYVNGGISLFADGGWVAYFYSEDEQTVVQINSNPQTSIVNFGDGAVLVIGTSETGCSFDWSQNDASGLKGDIDCNDTLATSTSGTQMHVDFHATVDAHT